EPRRRRVARELEGERGELLADPRAPAGGGKDGAPVLGVRTRGLAVEVGHEVGPGAWGQDHLVAAGSELDARRRPPESRRELCLELVDPKVGEVHRAPPDPCRARTAV